MSDLTCLHCGATTHNGLVLCELCRYRASDTLASLPVHIRNLARWKPGRAGSRPVPGSRVLWDGETRAEAPDRVSRALNEVGNDLTTWARSLADDRELEVPDGDTEVEALVATCAWLSSHLVSIGTLEWAGEFVSSLIRSERRLAMLTLTVVPGWYAGSCKRKVAMATDEDNGLCGAATYVVPGLTWVTCSVCGTTTYARDHLETILDEARGWTARPMRLAEAIVALVDTEQSVTRLYERIKKWRQREQLDGIRELDSDGDPVGAYRYNLGAVLDLLFTEGETRAEEISPNVASAS